MADPGIVQAEQAPPPSTAWAADLLAAVSEHQDHIDDLTVHAWVAALPGGYPETVSPTDAATDLTAVQALGSSRPALTMRLRRPSAAGAAWRLAVYHRGPAVPLSALLPLLESFGFTVLDERPFRLPAPGSTDPVQLHDVGVAHPILDDPGPGVLRAGPDPGRHDLLTEAVEAVWRGDADIDRLNRLVLGADLPWAQVAVLRAYRRYRRQVGTAFSADYLDRAVVEPRRWPGRCCSTSPPACPVQSGVTA